MNNNMILHLEQLARLNLSESERRKILPETEELIEYFNTLSELDTDGTEPLSHTFGLSNVMRSDEVLPSLPAEKITQNAETENGMFTVPISVKNSETEAEDD